MDTTLKRALRVELLQVISSAGDLRTRATDAGLQSYELPQDGPLSDRLDVVLELCERRGGDELELLLTYAQEDYPARPWVTLRKVLATLEQHGVAGLVTPGPQPRAVPPSPVVEAGAANTMAAPAHVAAGGHAELTTSSTPPTPVTPPAQPAVDPGASGSGTGTAPAGYDVFIAYAEEDFDRVLELAQHLWEQDLRVFLDEWELVPGDATVHRLEEGIGSSRNGLVAVSRAAERCLYAREEYNALMTRAIEQGIRVVPVLLEDANRPPFLSARQPADLRDPRAPRYSVELEKLVRAFKGLGPLRPAARANGSAMPAARPVENAVAIDLKQSEAPDTTPPSPFVSGPARILFLAANPLDTDRLSIDVELREIRDRLRSTDLGNVIDLQERWAVRPRDLIQALQDLRPAIVHFSGHGGGAQGLYLQGEGLEAQAVSSEALDAAFRLVKGLRCVVLDACYSEVQAEVIRQHIDYVVGMRGAVGDMSARIFSTHFYGALGSGVTSIETAFEWGRAALLAEGRRDAELPVLLRREG